MVATGPTSVNRYGSGTPTPLAPPLSEAEYPDALEASGWTDVEIRYTHEVHEFAKAAIVRAVRP